MSKKLPFKKGDTVECVTSASNAYKKGHYYVVSEKDSILGLTGDDGLFDPLSMLVSGFKKKEQKCLPHLKNVT